AAFTGTLAATAGVLCGVRVVVAAGPAGGGGAGGCGACCCCWFFSGCAGCWGFGRRYCITPITRKTASSVNNSRLSAPGSFCGFRYSIYFCGFAPKLFAILLPCEFTLPCLKPLGGHGPRGFFSCHYAP